MRLSTCTKPGIFAALLREHKILFESGSPSLHMFSQASRVCAYERTCRRGKGKEGAGCGHTLCKHELENKAFSQLSQLQLSALLERRCDAEDGNQQITYKLLLLRFGMLDISAEEPASSRRAATPYPSQTAPLVCAYLGSR